MSDPYAHNLKALLAARGIRSVDTSWGNDSCPSFGILDSTDGPAIRCFTEARELALREDGGGRFGMVTRDGDRLADCETEAEAVAILVALHDELHGRDHDLGRFLVGQELHTAAELAQGTVLADRAATAALACRPLAVWRALLALRSEVHHLHHSAAFGLDWPAMRARLDDLTYCEDLIEGLIQPVEWRAELAAILAAVVLEALEAMAELGSADRMWLLASAIDLPTMVGRVDRAAELGDWAAVVAGLEALRVQVLHDRLAGTPGPDSYSPAFCVPLGILANQDLDAHRQHGQAVAAVALGMLGLESVGVCGHALQVMAVPS